jgi:hypothetical protein
MRRYTEPTSQLSTGLRSLLQSFDDYARRQSHAQGRRFIEVRTPEGELRTSLVQYDQDPFDPATELAREIDLLRTLIQEVRHRHTAVPIINGIANGLLGARGYGFTQRLVEEGDLSAEGLDAIRHAIRYDTEHPQHSPELATIRQGAVALLPALEHYARRHGIPTEVETPRPAIPPSLLRWICPVARRIGLRRWCLTSTEAQPA